MVINNLRGAGSFRDNLRLYDGYDSSRDLIALYSTEGKQGEDYYFKINLANLKPGVEKNLDLYLLINLNNQKEGSFSFPDNIAGETKFPWQLSLCIYDSKNSIIKDSSNNAYEGAIKNLKFNYAGKYIEFFLDKKILGKIGWKDNQALNLQVFSVKDKQNKIIDSLPSAFRGQGTSLPQSISTDHQAGHDTLSHFWEDEVVYFAFTDRFSNGDKSNDGTDANLADPRAFHGGDWQGIIDKLDYIKNLGATCIWISPVIMNEPKGYHAYWPYDFMKSEPHFGSMSKLKELVEKAHSRGLKIVMDLVLNHTGYTHPWTKDQNYYDWFHHKGDMWLPIPYQMENYSFAGLPDLAQENPKVYRYLLNMAKYWIKESNCDGIRLDAAQNIPHWFWKKFTQEIRNFSGPNFLILGEAFNPFPNWVGSYQKDGLDSMFDVPMTWAMRDVFAYNKKKSFIKRLKEAKDFFGNNPCDAIRKVLTLNSGNMYELKLFFSQDSAYDNPNLMVNFIDNHDLTRFMEEAQDKEKLKLALSFIFTIRGFPAFYYGTEAGMTGGDWNKDNAFRKDMDWSYEDFEMKEHFKKLTRIRKKHIALRRGIQKELYVDRDTYAFLRIHPGEEVVAVFNNSEQEQNKDIPIKGSNLIKDKTILKDLMGNQTYTVNQNKLKLTLKPKEAKILALNEPINSA